MTLQSVKVSPLISFSMSDGALRYNVESSPVLLPTSNPGTPQCNYTITQEQMPVLSFNPFSIFYDVVLFAWGKNNDASNHSISYNSYKGVDSIATGSYTINASSYWTLQAGYTAIANPVGILYGLSVWDTAGTVDLRGVACIVYPTKVKLEKNSDMLYNVNFSSTGDSATFDGISETNSAKGGGFYYIYDDWRLDYFNTSKYKKLLSSSMYCFSHYYQDGSSYIDKVVGKNSSTAYPYYQAFNYPRIITYQKIYAEGKL